MVYPRVSVLIPSYNAEKYIGETLESVLRQTWPEMEVIVVDDGSQDSSADVVERFGSRRVQLIRQANAGASAARNRAYQASSGAFVQFIDADDLIGPEKIERQARRLSAYPGCVASAEWGRFYSSWSQTRFDPEPVWRDLHPLDWLILSRSDGLGMLFPALWLIPRAVADAAGPWDEALSIGDDTEYFTRVLLVAERVLFCAGARCHYRSGRSGSLSRQKSGTAWLSHFRGIEICESHVRACEDSERVRRGFALSWQHFAYAAYPYCHALAERALARSLALHPIKIQPSGGHGFHLAMRVMGWRLARHLQVALGRP